MSESNQKWIGRNRKPRVQITYDVEIGDAIETKELPFIVGVLADLSGNPKTDLPPIAQRKFVEIDRDNFNKVLASIEPRIVANVDNVLPGAESDKASVELLFNKIDDFYPTDIVKRTPLLQGLYQGRCHLRDMLAKMDGNDALIALTESIITDADKKTAIAGLFEGDAEAWGQVVKTDIEGKDGEPPTLEDILETVENETLKDMLNPEVGQMVLDINQIEYALQLIGQFLKDIAADAESDGEGLDVAALINKSISEIDGNVTAQLNLIMHDPAFQKLEASWRGLHYLVMNTETGEKLKIRLLNISKKDLYKDLLKAVEFDQSALFKLVYEEEYGTYGGDPFSALVGDFEFGRHPDDIKLLELISGVAAAAHAPFVTAAYAKLFDLDSFGKLYNPRDLSKIFESAELIKWRSFRETEDSRYVTLTLPRVMLRLPYGEKYSPVEDMSFEENVMVLNEEGVSTKRTDAKLFLWGNPAYVLAQRITNAFAHFGWTAAIRGVEGGGLVEGLPSFVFETDDGELSLTCPTEVALTDRREKELNDLGFMPICHCKGTDKAAFFGGQTTNRPKTYNTDSANSNSRISAMLPYVLSASRFAHYIKVLMREKIGKFMTRSNVEDYLNTWIAQYILLDDTPPQDVKARYPLREARVEVSDVPGKPGSYRATVFLKPHFQLEELTTSIRLVAELPS
ncbi:type VI secretion system contractile sheath large subunit [Aliikangiella coralliicola]|uniref:Type VI secretion system contractile sheath large subunit n=1 Tax=Aliikangiella coralliicola TaxID=2592383 RepID=A0A545UCT1_9GAMM|nr:type VI secretion system contractile sheath large subunit [Aliikangiella coralliicola]TQV87270.1 type VI secretion system contractile sheath large subunit [Aliikangiella coralliicola]